MEDVKRGKAYEKWKCQSMTGKDRPVEGPMETSVIGVCHQLSGTDDELRDRAYKCTVAPSRNISVIGLSKKVNE